MWEWIRSSSTDHLCIFIHCKRSVTETITIGIRIPWVGSRIAFINIDTRIGLVDIWNTVIVPIKIEDVTDSITVLINRHIACIDRVRTTVDFVNVAPSIVVIVKVLFEWRCAVRRWEQFVWITVTIGVFPCRWVEWEHVRSGRTVAGHW